jgi:hypothetical protein
MAVPLIVMLDWNAYDCPPRAHARDHALLGRPFRLARKFMGAP